MVRAWTVWTTEAWGQQLKLCGKSASLVLCDKDWERLSNLYSLLKMGTFVGKLDENSHTSQMMQEVLKRHQG